MVHIRTVEQTGEAAVDAPSAVLCCGLWHMVSASDDFLACSTHEGISVDSVKFKHSTADVQSA